MVVEIKAYLVMRIKRNILIDKEWIKDVNCGLLKLDDFNLNKTDLRF